MEINIAIFMIIIFGIMIWGIFTPYQVDTDIKRKTKTLNRLLIKARVFLRPYNTLNEMTLANQYCEIKFQFKINRVIFTDKMEGFVEIDDVNGYSKAEKIFEYFCNNFKYSTRYIRAIDMANTYYKSAKCNCYNKKYSQSYYTLDINNASAAELIAIPGMNAAKANKINKEILKNNKRFDTIYGFIGFANINDADANILKSIFKSSTKCDIKDLPFYKKQINNGR